MPYDKASDVVDDVKWLEDDGVMKAMREDMRRRWRLTNLQLDPDMPDHITRDGAAIILSPLINNVRRSLLADTMAYSTTLALSAHVPEGENPETYRNKGDEAEPFFVLGRQRDDDGLRVSKWLRNQQLISTWGVSIMDFAPEGESVYPWSIDCPAPDTVFFPEMRLPGVPTMMGLRQRMLISDVKSKYNGQKRTDFAGSQFYIDKAGQWQQVSEGRAVDDEWSSRSGSKRHQDVEVVKLWSDGWCYHVAMNLKDDGVTSDEGMIIWKYPSMTGGVPAVVITGDSRGLTGRYAAGPFLHDIMQTTSVRNLISSFRMTIVQNAKPDSIILHDPEAFELAKTNGWLRVATETELTEAGPQLVHIPGKQVHFWERPSIEDLDKLEQRVIDEEKRYLDAILSISSRETAQQSTATGLTLVSGNIETQQSEMLKQLDYAFSMFGVFKAISLTGYDPRDYDPTWSNEQKAKKLLIQAPAKPYGSSYALHAGDNVRAGRNKTKLEAGKSYGADAKALDFGFDVVVVTRNITPAKRQADLNEYATKASLGLADLDDGIEASGAPDVKEVRRKLALEEGRKAAAQAHIGLAVLMVDTAIELSAGANIAGIRERAVQMQMAQAQAAGGTGSAPGQTRPNTGDGATGGSVPGAAPQSAQGVVG